ncbi:MAG TPA: heparan-alpha-glucosaminide N-acetyltransferase domain-containing protein [Kofleriaceae bacterium]|nr:heparan-alpha-glucosaminide N-acetyltransferase domain-containing protein [Kofleriaceae bacterium]
MAPPGRAAGARRRAVDAVRGVAMIVMALDHLRDFLGSAHFDATDLGQTTLALFASRWVTHFCAPTFFLLAGVSAYLSIASGRRSVRGAARFLVVRGLALVVVEQTVLRCLGWYFHFDYHYMNAGVLFGLGWSMVLLGGLVFVPPAVGLVVGLAIVLGEAGIAAADLGDGGLGTLLALATRSRDFEPVAGYHFFVSYPPIPWFGAMALGYGLAARIYREPAGDGAAARRRQRTLIALAAAALAVFVVVRGLNLADPALWAAQGSRLFTALSFVNLSKYPPSTPFLLMTLAGALLALAAFERWPRAGRIFEVYGRVPLLFYLLHIPLIHGIAVVYSYAAFGAATWLTSGPVIFWDVALPGSPDSYGLGIAAIWLVWLALIAALYPVCRWYGARRQ